MSIATEITRLQTAKADLKTAINAKGGSLTTELIGDYALAVNGLEVGGVTPTGDWKVTYYDYDGSIIKEDWVLSGQNSVAPTPPDHSDVGLTFVEWNYSSTSLTNINSHLIVGATYNTTDNKTHIYVDARLNKTVHIYLNSLFYDGFVFDWGDGVTEDRDSWGAVLYTHTYVNAGIYVIKINSKGTNKLYSLGHGGGASFSIEGSISTRNNRSRFIKVFCSSQVSGLETYAFYIVNKLEEISLSSTIVSILREGSFHATYALKCLIIPKSMVSPSAISHTDSMYGQNNIIFNDNAFIARGNDFALYSGLVLYFPIGISSLPSSFGSSNNLNRIVIPSTSVPTLASSTYFSGLASLGYIYVRDSLVTSFKTATNWTAYAHLITPMSELY